ncbi:MAG TPA: class II aldolase/adducin family protein [Ignavibacteriaceae bacterium]|nr:class II aldolase/adducin family protein [Ignavibacteriaceae bacterium]
MKFSVVKSDSNLLRDRLAEEIINACRKHGDTLSDFSNDIDYVLNLTSFKNPKTIRRKSKSVIVVSIIADGRLLTAEDVKEVCYNTLIKTLSNLLIYISYNYETYFTTPEAGFYELIFNPEEIYKRMHPVVSSQFATDNIFTTDLPSAYWNGTKATGQINFYGKYLDNLGVLPVPFPLKNILSKEQLVHLYKIFGITGASYGNLSVRERIPQLSEHTFWMTGRGVDKSNLNEIGKDIFLVKDFDFKNYAAILSMPLQYDPKARVSVDAVEHALIYRSFPQTGAIVHVHAWMEGILCTRQNYPCGTIELANEVVALLNETEDPCNAVIGLKNHGLTITGKSLKEIFERISDKLITEVEMFA